MDPSILLEKLKELTELRAKMDILKGIMEERRAQEAATAILVEPRRHRAISFVVRNVLENLKTNWNVRIFHGTSNQKFLEELLAGELQPFSPRIQLENLGVENLPTPRDYSKLLTSREFVEKIPTEIFLIFQTDSMINPRYRDLLTTFLKYDYVGAPWTHGGVGNGGFSLRKRSKMLEIIDSVPPYEGEYEDTFFSNGTEKVIVNKPPAELAALFSVETVYSAVSFGVHMAWKYHPMKVEEMCNNCPGLAILISLQSCDESVRYI
jgi:hypothetical protein